MPLKPLFLIFQYPQLPKVLGIHGALTTDETMKCWHSNKICVWQSGDGDVYLQVE